jgi:hypothetical protein
MIPIVYELKTVVNTRQGKFASPKGIVGLLEGEFGGGGRIFWRPNTLLAEGLP